MKSGTVIKLKCASLSLIDHGTFNPDELTVGKEYDVTIRENHSVWNTTQCSFINDKGQEQRVLGGHFVKPSEFLLKNQRRVGKHLNAKGWYSKEGPWTLRNTILYRYLTWQADFSLESPLHEWDFEFDLVVQKREHMLVYVVWRQIEIIQTNRLR